MDRLPVRVKLIIIFTVLVAISSGFISFKAFGIERDIWSVLFFLVLALVCESLVISLPDGINVSVLFALAVSVIILFTPFTAGLIMALGTMFSVFKKGEGYKHIFNTPYYKTLFNGANFFLAIMTGGSVYRLLGGPSENIVLTKAVIPVIAGIAVDIFINTSLVTLLISSLVNRKFNEVWQNNTGWIIQNFLIMSPMGIILALAFENYGYIGVLLFFGPLLMARYSFKIYMDLRRSYLETVQALSKALEAKDPITSGHAERVSKYAIDIARELKLSEAKIDRIRYAALLHDIGKIGIADGILKKPGSLSEDEFDNIKKHPVIGYEILKDIDFLRDVARIIRYHHERYDGTGYPDRLKGKEVPIESYILAVADAFDAMTHDRPYRKALSVEEAAAVISREAGWQFHPEVAKAFLRIKDKGLLEYAN